MPAKGHPRLESRTQLAVIRFHAGVTQVEMARRVGVSIATYQRMEAGRLRNPPLRYLVNAAIILDVPVQQLVEPEWLTWRSQNHADPSVERAARWSDFDTGG